MTEYLQIVRDPKTGRFTKVSDTVEETALRDYEGSGIAAAYAILGVVAIICGGIGYLIGHFA